MVFPNDYQWFINYYRSLSVGTRIHKQGITPMGLGNGQFKGDICLVLAYFKNSSTERGAE